MDAGAFLQTLEYGASCEATVLGKPSVAFVAEVVQSLGLPAARCLMVGDDVEADVLGAIAAGLAGCGGRHLRGGGAAAPEHQVMTTDQRPC